MRGRLSWTPLLLALAGSVAAEAEPVEIEILGFRYTPAEISVPAGTTVRWVNREKRQYHNVWFDTLDEKEPDYFFPEESYERTFNEPGEYPYRCGPHPEMRGVVRVTQ